MTTREDMPTRLPSAVAESVSTAGQTFCATGMSLPFNKFMLVVEYHSISYMLIVECVRIPSCNTLQSTIYAFTTERICQLFVLRNGLNRAYCRVSARLKCHF